MLRGEDRIHIDGLGGGGGGGGGGAGDLYNESSITSSDNGSSSEDSFDDDDTLSGDEDAEASLKHADFSGTDWTPEAFVDLNVPIFKYFDQKDPVLEGVTTFGSQPAGDDVSSLLASLNDVYSMDPGASKNQMLQYYLSKAISWEVLGQVMKTFHGNPIRLFSHFTPTPALLDKLDPLVGVAHASLKQLGLQKHLGIAVKRANIGDICALIQSGASPNAPVARQEGQCPLWLIAIKTQSPLVMHYLTSNSMQVVNVEYGRKGGTKRSIFRWALHVYKQPKADKKAMLEVIRALLLAGVMPTSKDLKRAKKYKDIKTLLERYENNEDLYDSLRMATVLEDDEELSAVMSPDASPDRTGQSNLSGNASAVEDRRASSHTTGSVYRRRSLPPTKHLSQQEGGAAAGSSKRSVYERAPFAFSDSRTLLRADITSQPARPPQLHGSVGPHTPVITRSSSSAASNDRSIGRSNNSQRDVRAVTIATAGSPASSTAVASGASRSNEVVARSPSPVASNDHSTGRSNNSQPDVRAVTTATKGSPASSTAVASGASRSNEVVARSPSPAASNDRSTGRSNNSQRDVRAVTTATKGSPASSTAVVGSAPGSDAVVARSSSPVASNDRSTGRSNNSQPDVPVVTTATEGSSSSDLSDRLLSQPTQELHNVVSSNLNAVLSPFHNWQNQRHVSEGVSVGCCGAAQAPSRLAKIAHIRQVGGNVNTLWHAWVPSSANGPTPAFLNQLALFFALAALKRPKPQLPTMQRLPDFLRKLTSATPKTWRRLVQQWIGQNKGQYVDILLGRIVANFHDYRRSFEHSMWQWLSNEAIVVIQPLNRWLSRSSIAEPWKPVARALATWAFVRLSFELNTIADNTGSQLSVEFHQHEASVSASDRRHPEPSTEGLAALLAL